jgi:hypothetical protein
MPAEEAETGMCRQNVAAQVALHGGRPAHGWAIWANKLFLMAEFHVAWVSPDGRTVDITPAAEDEDRILFAVDDRYPVDFDWSRRPLNRAMRTVGRPDPAAEGLAIDAMSPTQRAYEERRATKKGLDLPAHVAAKLPLSDLAIAVDDLIRCCSALERLYVPTTSGLYSPDPKAFAAMRSRVEGLYGQIGALLAKQSR